jgi:hypothetical protein
MSREPSGWYDHNADNPAWIKALAEVRHRAVRRARPLLRAKHDNGQTRDGVGSTAMPRFIFLIDVKSVHC